MAKNTPQDTEIRVSPNAVVIVGHVAADRLTDPGTPILTDPRELRRAGELRRIDLRCGFCDSTASVCREPDALIITIGHRDGCRWWEAVYANAMEREGAEIAAFAAGLAATGTVTA